jgi:hypothetical protein
VRYDFLFNILANGLRIDRSSSAEKEQSTGIPTASHGSRWKNAEVLSPQKWFEGISKWKK